MSKISFEDAIVQLGLKYNSCHAAGSGQFCSGGGGSAGAIEGTGPVGAASALARDLNGRGGLQATQDTSVTGKPVNNVVIKGKFETIKQQLPTLRFEITRESKDGTFAKYTNLDSGRNISLQQAPGGGRITVH